MSLYTIGDLHLSLGTNKPMDVFGGAWTGYVDKLQKGFAAVGPEDTVVLCGDLSYYWIADRQGRSFKRLNELYAANGQVGFLASQRVDGKIILPEAVKVLVQKAS